MRGCLVQEAVRNLVLRYIALQVKIAIILCIIYLPLSPQHCLIAGFVW